MAYNAAIPAANDLISQSQAEIQENFSQIQTVVGINHYTFGATGEGKHLYIQLPEHVAPTTAIDEAAFYANVGATSTVTELYFRRENNGVSIPMTECLTNANGWSFLPSGILMQWGTTNVASGGQTIVFPRAFPTSVYNVQVTSADPGANIKVFSNVSAITVNNFTVRLRGQNGGDIGGPIYFMALGV